MKITENKSFEKLNYPLFNIVSIILSILLILRFSFTVSPINLVLLSIITFLVFTMLSLISKKNRMIEISKVVYVIVLGFLLRFASIQMETGNDVFWVSEGAVKSLLNSTNPYTATYFVPNNPAWAGIPLTLMTYFPGTTLFEIPFYLIFGDVRYAVLCADVGIAVMLYLIIRNKNEDYGRAAMSFYMLVTSLTFVFPNIVFDYRLTDGLTDPIMTFLLLCTVYAYMKNKVLPAAILLGFALGTRQFAVLFFVPMMILWLKKDVNQKRDYKSLVASVLIASLIITPFFVWSPADFIRDALTGVGGQQLNPSLGNPQWNMSIPAQLVFFGINIGINTAHIIQIAFMAGLLILLRKKITDVYSVTLVFTILYVIFLAFSNFSQYFYWFNVIPYLLIVFAHVLTDLTKQSEIKKEEK